MCDLLCIMWSAPSPRSRRVVGSAPTQASLHVLPVPALVLSRYSGFFAQCRDMHIRVIADN